MSYIGRLGLEAGELEARLGGIQVVKSIPGGAMLVPMIISAILNTFFADFVQIGGVTTGLLSGQGTMAFVALLLIFSGIQVKPYEMKESLKHGGVLAGLKLIFNLMTGLFLMSFFGLEGILGVSTLAIISCIASSNGGIYMAMVQQYGRESEKVNFTLFSIVGLPFVAVAILGISSGVGLDYMAILAALLPFILGVILGMLDPKLKESTKNGVALIIPFLGIGLGASIDLRLAFTQSQTGIILFLLCLLFNNLPLYFVDRKLLKKEGYVSAGLCCIAGIALTVPKLVAEVDSSYAPFVDVAMAQIAFALLLSSIVTPILGKRMAMRNAEDESKSTSGNKLVLNKNWFTTKKGEIDL